MKITDCGVAKLSSLQNLQFLNLNACRHITDASAASIASLLQLQHLNLQHCNKVTHVGIAHLLSLKLLETLHINRNCNVSDQVMSQLRAAVRGTVDEW